MRRNNDIITNKIRISLTLFCLLILLITSLIPIYDYGQLNSDKYSLINIYHGKISETHIIQIPPNIIMSVPITIENSENLSTGPNFQQELIVNSSRFAKYETYNLQNVEFFYSNGTIINSWLESGNNSTYNTIYWLKLSNGIPPHSNITIYMGFANKVDNLFNNVTTGEAPNLSPIYGEYDNGKNVFMEYWNFNGTTLPVGWKTYTNSQPIAMAYYYTNISTPFEVISEPSDSRFVIGISDADQIGNIGHASVFYPGVSFWGDDGVTYGLYVYNSTPTLLSSQGPTYFPIQLGVGYRGDDYISIFGDNETIETSKSLSIGSQNLIFVSSDTYGVGGSSQIYANDSLFLSVSLGTYGQITTKTYFLATAMSPPNGVMPTSYVDSYKITISENGIPKGMPWSLILGNKIFNSTSNNISMLEYPGEYKFNIVPGYGMIPNPSSGSINLTDENMTINIRFSTPEPIAEAPITIFNNLSLPTGLYDQFLTVNGSKYQQFLNNNWSNIEFIYKNGTYIQAWLNGPNNNTSVSQIVLKMYSIPAESNITIYMIFFPKNISIVSEYGPTGELNYSANGTQLLSEDNGAKVFAIYANFLDPYFPSSWYLVGSAQFIPNEGVETVNGNNGEMGAVIYNGSIPNRNITVLALSYYQGNADQQNIGVFSNYPSPNNGDNGGVGENGYTIGFDPYYSVLQIYYNGSSVSSTSFWSGGTSYFLWVVQVNSTSILGWIYQYSNGAQGTTYGISYNSRIYLKGGLFFSSSTGGSTSIQYLYVIEAAYYPPDHYMPTSKESEAYSILGSYLEEAGIALSGNFTSISVRTYAGEYIGNQINISMGQFVSLNTNQEYSFVIGLVYDWPTQKGILGQGFALLYSRFNKTQPNATTLFNSSYLINITGNISNGDAIILNISINTNNNTLVISLYDINTHLRLIKNYEEQGLKYFIGTLESSFDENKNFTGIFTLEDTIIPGFSEFPVTYYTFESNYTLRSSWIWIRQYYWDTLIFNNQISVISNSSSSYPFFLYSNGTLVETNGSTFLTGIYGSIAPITFLFSVLSVPYGRNYPVLTFMLDSIPFKVPLHNKSLTVYADIGSYWRIIPYYYNISSGRRISLPSGLGLVSGQQMISLKYYNQIFVSFSYDIIGGGIGFTPPSVSFVQFGTLNTVELSNIGIILHEWVDNGTIYDYPISLYGLSSFERWLSVGNTTGALSYPCSINVSYINQYYVTFKIPGEYSGGWYNNSTSILLNASNIKGWKFIGWSIAILNSLGQNVTSFFVNSTLYTLKINSPINILEIMYVSVKIYIINGGSINYEYSGAYGTVSNSNVFYVPPGTIIKLSANAPIPGLFGGWFMDGKLVSSSNLFTLNVSSPVIINAFFNYQPAIIFGISDIITLILIIFFIGISAKNFIKP